LSYGAEFGALFASGQVGPRHFPGGFNHGHEKAFFDTVGAPCRGIPDRVGAGQQGSRGARAAGHHDAANAQHPSSVHGVVCRRLGAREDFLRDAPDSVKLFIKVNPSA
jgi:hypothetical protein